MIKRKFDKEFMLGLLWGDHDEDVEVVLENPVCQSRWTVDYQLIFKYKDKYYETSYSRGATEYQDEQPWQDEDEVECVEVEPQLIQRVLYVPVEETSDAE